MDGINEGRQARASSSVLERESLSTDAPGQSGSHAAEQTASGMHARPRVIFLNRFFYPDLSATSQMLSDLAFGLAERGFDVQVITSRLRYDDPASRLQARETVRGVRVHRIWTSGFGRHNLWGRGVDYFTFYISAFCACLRLLRPGDVLVAKTDPPVISVVAAISASSRRAKLVNWLQDLFPEVAAAAGVRTARGTTGKLLCAVRDWSLKRAFLNVAIGYRMHNLLLARGLQENRIRVVENWADGAHLRPVPADANPLRDEWNLGNKFVVGYSGNMGVAHEFDTILDTADRLRNNKNICFVFIGGGKRRPQLMQEVKRRRLENVIIRPYQPRERLSESLSVADIHLISLRPEFEGLVVPSKFYGISATGRLCLYIGDPRGELARKIDPKNRFCIGDAIGLAQRIEELHLHSEELRHLGALTRIRFSEEDDLPERIVEWTAILQSCHREVIESVRHIA